MSSVLKTDGIYKATYHLIRKYNVLHVYHSLPVLNQQMLAVRAFLTGYSATVYSVFFTIPLEKSPEVHVMG